MLSPGPTTPHQYLTARPTQLNSIDFYGVEEGSQASLVMISYNFSLVFFFNRARPNGYPKWFKCITNQRNLTTSKVTIETQVGFPCLVCHDAMSLVPRESLLTVWWKQKQITFCLLLGKFLFPDH